MQVEDLLQHCTVKLSIPGQLGWGTGFFVAQGLILTCAHVVNALVTSDRVQVGCQQQVNFAEAELVERVPGLDLALLRFTLRGADLPVVYLDEELETGQDLYFFGYPDVDFEHGCPVTVSCEGLTGDVSPLIKFKQGQVRPGMSGSALLNRQTGKVCGMVKFTRDRSFDLGGGAIPTRVILEQFPQLRALQREFHEGDRRWTNLITAQNEIGFQPYLQAVLANEDYREWQAVYTPTTVEDRRRMPAQDTAIVSQRQFSSRLKLRVEMVKPDKSEQGDQPDRAPKPQEKVEKWDVLEGLRNYATENVVLIGKPGSGKSTSLERLLWEEAEKALHDPNARIPVLVKLRRCTRTIEGLIRDFLVGHQHPLELAEIERLLSQGKFLLLLDGLNELPEVFRTEIANFYGRYRHTTSMIASTRDLSGGGILGIEKTLKMLPLTEPQMREFVQGYLGEEGDRLFQQLQGDRLRKFAETPLLLWMLCRVFAHNGKVPDNLGLAFREFAQLHDQELQADAPVDSQDQWHGLLRHLAFVMMQGKNLIDPQLSIPRKEAEDCLTAYLQQESRSNPRGCAERWLKDLLKYHLIQPVIQADSKEHIEFRHQLIQEYYAAEALLVQLPKFDDEQLKREFLNYLKWKEPVALMLALVDQAQAERVVKLALEVDLMLGARLIGEVKSALQSAVVVLIEQLKVSQQLKIRLLGMTATTRAINYLGEALKTEHLRIRQTIIKVLSKICSEAIISPLKIALSDGAFTVRLEAIRALVDMQATEMVPILISMICDDEPSIQDVAICGLKSVNTNVLIFHFQQTLLNQTINTPVQVIKAIEATGEKAAIDLLLQLFRDPGRDIGWKAAYVLAKVNGESAIKYLSEQLSSENIEIRRRAAYSLGETKSVNAVEILSKAAADKDIEVRNQAIKGLGKLGGQSIVEPLMKALKDKNTKIRNQALSALASNKDQYTIKTVALYLNDENPEICQKAAYILGEIGDDSLTDTLLKALDNEDPEVRRCIIEALGKIGSHTAIDALETALWDVSLEVREEAAFALGRFGNDEAEIDFPDDDDDDDGIERDEWDEWERSAFLKCWDEDEKGWDDEFKDSEVEFNGSEETFMESEFYMTLMQENLEITYVPPKLWRLLLDSNEPISCRDFENLEEEDNDMENHLITVTDLGELADSRALSFLSKCLFSEDGHDNVIDAILTIQANCKYYNYEVFQGYLAAQQADRESHEMGDRSSPIYIQGDYIAGDKIQGDKIEGDKYDLDRNRNQLPGA